MQLEALTGTLGYTFNDAGLKAAQRELRATNEANLELTTGHMEGAEWADKHSQKLAAGAVAAGVFATAGAGVTAALVDSVSAAKDYDAVMAQVATLSPEAAAKTGEFKQEVLDLSARMGGDAVESANAMYDALSSGIPADNVMTFMSSASKFAVAGATDVGTAVKGLAGTINAWGLEATEATAISDTFFQGQNLGVFRVNELASSIGNVSGLAASLNISYKDVTASTATMTLQNMTAAESITRQRAAIVSVITPNEKMHKVLKDLAVSYPEVAAAAEAQGISIGEAAFKTLGFQGTLEAVRGSAENTGTVLAEATGSVEALGGILALTGDNATLARTNLDAMNSSAGSTANAFAILSESTDQKWKVMTATFNNAKIALGDALLPVVSAVLDMVSPLADGALAVARAFGEMPTPVKALVVGLGALAIAGAGVTAAGLLMASTLGPGLISITGATTGLLGPTGALALAWGGVGVAMHGAAAAAGGALLAMAPLLPIALAVGAVVMSLKKGHDEWAASMAKAYTGVQQLGGGFDAYLAATKKANAETTGLAKVWATLGTNEGLDLQASTRAWLTYGAGVDEALLKTTEFQKAQQEAGQEWRKTGDVEAYKTAMLAAADAASVAAGKGHLLSVEQKAIVTEFQAATAVLVERSGMTADAMATDEEFITTQDRLSRAVADGAMTQQQALSEMNAYIAKRSEQADADKAAAQAAADGASRASGAVEMYSKSLQQLSGGSAVSFAPDRERSKEDIKEQQKNDEKLRDERIAHFADMYAKRQEFQAQESLLISQGKTEELGKLREGYALELAAQQEHLGQLAVNQIMANLQAGTLAEGQAQLMLGSLQAAFPDADFLQGNLAAMTHFSATLGGALQGNTEDALNLGAAVAGVPKDLDAGAAGAEAYEQRSVAAFQAAKQASEDSAAGVVESDMIVRGSSAQRAAMIGENLTGEQGHMTTTAGVAQTTGGQVETSMRGVAGSAKTTAGAFAGSMGSIRTEVATLPGAMSKAAGDTQAQASAIGRAFEVSGEKARAYGREARQGIEDAASANAAAASSAEELGSTGETGHAKVATSAQGSTRAVNEFGSSATTAYTKTKDAQKEVEEQTGRVETALKKVPKELEIKTELPQYPRFMGQMDSILRKIKEIDNAAMHAARSIQAIIDKQGQASGAGGAGGGNNTPAPPPPGGRPRGDFLPPPGDVSATADAMTGYGDLVNYVGDAYGYMGDSATAATSASGQALTIMQEAIARLDAWTATEPDWDALWAGIYRPFLEQAPTSEGSIAWMINQWRDTSILGDALGDPKFKAQVDLIEASFARINELVAAGDFENAKREWASLYGRIKEQEDRRHRDVLDHLDALAEPLDDQIKALRRAGEASGDSERYEKQIHALEMQKEAIADLKDKEDDRHKAALRHLEDQNRAVQDGQLQQKEWQDEQDRRMKAAQDAIKAEQKAYIDAENDAHTQVMRQIDDEAARRKDLHDSIILDIEDRKRIEAEAFQTSQAALDEGARIIKAGVDATARAIAGMRLEMDQAKLDLDIDGEQRRLKELTDDVSKFKDTLGKLERVETDPKKARDEERKRQAERVKLTTDAQREMLAKYRGMVGEEDQRTVDLMLAGFNVRATDAERIMAGIQAQLQGQADSQQGVVDAKQAQLDQMQQAIDKAEILAKVEKQAADDQLKVIEDLKRKNSEAHQEFVRQIEAEKRVEDVRYKAESQAISDLKKQEKERHEDRLKALNEQYALELLRLGKSEEEVNRIIAEQEAQAKRVAEAADARYKAAIAAIDAEAKRIEGEAQAREATVRERAETMRRELIERLRAILLVVGGDAAKAVDALLQKLLDPTFGVPAVGEAWAKAGEAGVAAVVAIGKAVADLGKQEERSLRLKQRVALPGEKLNASTRRGRGGFRAGHDWAAWHGTVIGAADPGLAGGLTPDPGTGGGTGIGDNRIGGPMQPFPWRYSIGPINDGLAEMNAHLTSLGMNLATLPPNFGGVAGGWTGSGSGKEKIDYHHYGDNVFVGDTAAEDFLTGLHMAP